MTLRPTAVNFNEKWDKLESTFENLITLQNVPRKVWNDHFSDIYALCVANPEPFADRLYSETKKFLFDHLKMILANVLESSRDELVTVYYNTWVQYSLGLRYLHCLFVYLNLQYVKKCNDAYVRTIHGGLSDYEPKCMVIGELGLTMWKEDVITALKDTLVELLLNGIMDFNIRSADDNMERFYQGSVKSFVCVERYKKNDPLKFYVELFEEPYLEKCGKFYELESSRLLQECNTTQYLENVWQLFEEEQQRCTKFLHNSSLPKVKAQFVKYVVTNHLAFLHEECRAMVQQEQFRSLRTMYLLLRLVVNGVRGLACEFLEHIKMKGLGAVSALTGDNSYVQFVECCLALHEKYSGVINNVFENDKCLVSALDEACSFVINKEHIPKQVCRSPEMLANYCDVLLRKSCKRLSDAELEDKLIKSIMILRYIEDKDVFQKFYSRMLAKRLIHQLSQSLDAEEAVINKLKHACEYEFTNKLRRMCTDIKVSLNINSEFSEFLLKENIDLGFSFSIYVLQAASWPLCQIPLTPVLLPMQLNMTIQKFEKFYHNHLSCRRLTFLHHHCQVDLKLNYLKKRYLIVMQTFQMAILLQFEKLNVLSYSELQEATHLTNEQFAKFIKSLVDSKLIICTDQIISESSLFNLNLTYVNKRTKFRIAAANQRESVQEVEQAHLSVQEDRKLYLHAVIVRIMKSHKVLNHNTLIQEILSLCRRKFTPDISAIKKAIESLIEKQYIERTPSSVDEYSYVA